MDLKKYPFVVVGAGPTGLGAAYQLGKHNKKFVVLEKSDHPGGLASSVIDEKGFTWDLGGHVHFSHYSEYDQALDQVTTSNDWNIHNRNSQIYLDGRFIPYPFQNNIHHLPFSHQLSVFKGLLKSRLFRKKSHIKNFSDWGEYIFGDGIKDLFFEPYNKKVWATPLEKLDIKWMEDRVAPLSLASLIKSIFLRKDQIAWGPNSKFRFPKKGGSGFIWTKMADFIGSKNINLNEEVLKINTQEKSITAGKGQYKYEKLISTLPIPVLTTRLTPENNNLKNAAESLLYSSVHSIGIGLRGQCPDQLKGIGWMYFPDPKIPFYRLTVFSHYSSFNVPDPKNQWSLLLEVPESPYLNCGIQEVIEPTVTSLLELGFISSRENIESTWSKRLEYGYPTPHLGRDENLDLIHNELQTYDIYSRGRFGGWKYEVSNQDHSFMQGTQIVDRLVLNKNEQIYS